VAVGLAEVVLGIEVVRIEVQTECVAFNELSRRAIVAVAALIGEAVAVVA
jgi:hypothetical protein